MGRFKEFIVVVAIAFFVSLYAVHNQYSVFKYFVELVDPDFILTTPEIIRNQGYPVETHIIESEDGYLLSYHRIPYGTSNFTKRKLYPVIMYHGLLSSSVDWIINGPNRSLAYRLADDGYDVWLANSRGNTESRAHVSMNPAQNEFWNFTFHEVGKYDIPAVINYILNVTSSQKVIHIGHSQGTTIFYVFATTRPELSDKVLVHISVAPTAMIPHATSMFRKYVSHCEEARLTGKWYGRSSFNEYNLMFGWISKVFCGRIFSERLCLRLVSSRITGRDDDQFHEDLFPKIFSKMPAGTSTKNLVHSAQLLNPGTFTQFDFGEEKNMKIYNQTTPPEYNLSQIEIPIRFYYGNNDIISNPLDTQLLYQKLSKPLGCIRIPFEKWNHVDFLWAKDVNQLFNEDLESFLQNVTENNDDFIESSVVRAIEERKSRPVPINVPFDEDAFVNASNRLSNESHVPLFLLDLIDRLIWMP